MSRRVNLPGADELFRATARPRAARDEATQASGEQSPGTSSGRVRHDEKMTIYLTSEELLAIESARIALRADLGIKVDRGRLVRAAIAGALAELAANGDESDLARRLDPA